MINTTTDFSDLIFFIGYTWVGTQRYCVYKYPDKNVTTTKYNLVYIKG